MIQVEIESNPFRDCRQAIAGLSSMSFWLKRLEWTEWRTRQDGLNVRRTETATPTHRHRYDASTSLSICINHR